MILVADSGSTKTDWVLADHGALTAEFNTIGFNPFFHQEKQINEALSNEPGLSAVKEKISAVHFFGAGCSSTARNKIILDALANFFVNAKISVEHDMKAAALATCGDEKGIACILGTGSNICYFDGKLVHETIHGLGYVLGDEGSGSYFGKKLLAHFLYRLLPIDLHKKFETEYQLSRETIIDKVYNQPDANVFLASFAPFLSDNREHPYIIHMVTKGMEEFFETNVCAIKDYKKVPVHFVGSIAFHFNNILLEVADRYEVKPGKIIKKPIYDLMKYFISV